MSEFVIPLALTFALTVLTCVGSKSSCEDCLLPADSGPCEALMQRYFFEQETCQCKTFTYGGCQGNANNFETKQECERKCHGCSKRCRVEEDPTDDVVVDANKRDPRDPRVPRSNPNPCARNDCKRCFTCVPEPKYCFTTPCPQYRCEEKKDCG